MDILHNQILSIQQRVVSLRDIYAEDQNKAERIVRAVVADLKVQTQILEKKNTNGASFLALIRRLPAEMLAELFQLAVCGNDQPPLELGLAGWLPVYAAHLRTFVCPCGPANKVDFILERTRQVPLHI